MEVLKNSMKVSKAVARWTFLAMLALGTSATSAKSKKGHGNSGVEKLQVKQGDFKGNQKKSLKSELLISKSEKKALRQVNKLIRKYRGTALEPGLQFRKAELYMRRAKTDRFFEFNRKSDTLVQLAPRVIRKASSRRHIKRAIATYERIQKKYPRFANIDKVVFNNAFARQSIGQVKTAEKLYFHLVTNYRNSPLVADAHLAIGEINFERKKFKHSLAHFNAIKKYPQSRVYPYGLYKAAWSHYNLSNARAGLKQLEEVVEYGRHVVKNNIDARLDLRKEAIMDMTLFYEDVKPSSEAFSYFKGQATVLNLVKLSLNWQSSTSDTLDLRIFKLS